MTPPPLSTHPKCGMPKLPRGRELSEGLAELEVDAKKGFYIELTHSQWEQLPLNRKSWAGVIDVDETYDSGPPPQTQWKYQKRVQPKERSKQTRGR